jgi:hypothetical protein
MADPSCHPHYRIPCLKTKSSKKVFTTSLLDQKNAKIIGLTSTK